MAYHGNSFPSQWFAIPDLYYYFALLMSIPSINATSAHNMQEKSGGNARKASEVSYVFENNNLLLKHQQKVFHQVASSI